MAIFSRRTIQRMLRENARFLTAKQVRDFAQRLNKADEKSLHSEWELALLNVMSKLGEVEHERAFGAKYPDIYLACGDRDDQKLIADVRTVSDRGRLPENLVELFQKRLRQELGRRKLKFEDFSCEIKRVGPDAEVGTYMTPQLLGFLDKVAGDRRSPGRYDSEGSDLVLSYVPGQASYTWSAPITSNKRLSNNPFYNALCDKLDQLEAPGFNGGRGIILCDGGSNMFYFRRTDVLQHGSDDVIRSFLRGNRQISFVMTVWVDRTPNPSQQFRLFNVRTQLFPNENFNVLDAVLRQNLSNIEHLFPLTPVTVETAIRSIHEGRGKQRWALHYWKPIVDENRKQIKISAIGLLQLLSGELRQDDFFEEQGFAPKGGTEAGQPNPFLRHLSSGELISDIALERSELDDDYVVITFAGRDAAVSTYQDDESGGGANESES